MIDYVVSRTALAVLAAGLVLLGGATHTCGTCSNFDQQAASTTIPTEATSTEEIASNTIPAFDPLNTDDVEAYVRAYFADIPVMVRVAKCESGFRQYNDNGNPLYGGTGGMVGVFPRGGSDT